MSRVEYSNGSGSILNVTPEQDPNRHYVRDVDRLEPPRRGGRLAIDGARRAGRSRALDALADAEPRRPVLRLAGTRELADVPHGAFRLALPDLPAPPSFDDVVAAGRDAIDDDGLLVVDDGRWLDGGSVRALSLLAGFAGLAIVAGRDHPLVTADTEVVEVQLLSPDGLRRLVEAELGGPVHREVIAELGALTGGRAGLAVPLLREARRADHVVRRRGVWILEGPLVTEGATAETAELLARPPDQRDALDLLAVAGRLGHDSLRTLGVTDEALVDLERDGLVQSVDGLITLSIPLLGVVGRAMLPTVRRTVLSARVVETEAHRFGPHADPDSVRLAVAAGVPVDGGALVRAGHAFVAEGDLGSAEEVAGQVPDGFDGPMLRAAIAAVAGASTSAHDAVAAALAAARDDGDRASAIEFDLTLTGLGLGQASAAVERARRALCDIADADARHRVKAAIALVSTYLGDLGPARDLDDAVTDPQSMAAGSVPTSLAHAVAGDVAAARAAARRGRAAVASIGQGAAPIGVLLTINEAYADLAEGSAVTARKRLAELAPVVVGTPLAGSVTANEAGMAAFMGDVTTGTALGLEAAIDLGHIDPFATKQALAAFRVIAAGLGGDEAGAAALLDDLDRAWPDPLPFAAGFVALGRAWRHLAGSDEDEAVPHLVAAVAAMQGAGQATFVPLAAHPLAHLDPTAVPGGLSGPPGGLADLVCREAAAIRSQDPAGLAAVAEDLRRGGFLAMAAEALLRAADLDSGPGAPQAMRAFELVARCPGARLPSFRERTPPLTPREVDVARVVAMGCSSAEAASRLHVSVRTIDNHLGRIYGKLGVGGRDDLPAIFGGLD